MSYARFGQEDSDVYLYPAETERGTHLIVCCMCALRDDSPGYTVLQDLANHLTAHITAGHVVPESALEAIHAERWIT